jgi:hypothetical protein
MVAPIIAGIIASLIQGNLPKVAEAVVEKGVDYVSDKLGVEIKPNMTEEELQRIATESIKHEEFRITQDNLNTDSAREMNLGIQESANASTLAKNAAYILDFVILASTIFLAGMAFFHQVPTENKELVYMALGSLLTLTGTVINFHRGSSSGSKDNGAAVRDALKAKE